MKKEEEQVAEKQVTKKLVWRLTKAPTVEEVNTLLEKEIIDKDEAREILFKTVTEENAEPLSMQRLEKELEFLRGLILQAMNNANATTVIKYIERPEWKPYRWDWIKPYYVTANALPANATFTMTTTSAPFNGAGEITHAVMKYPDTNGSFSGTSNPKARYVS